MAAFQLTVGQPPEGARGLKRRNRTNFTEEARALVDLARQDPNAWGNLGAPTPDPADATIEKAAQLVRSIAGKSPRKDFEPDGAFDARHEISAPFNVWARCLDPEAAEEAMRVRQGSEDAEDDSDEFDDETDADAEYDDEPELANA